MSEFRSEVYQILDCFDHCREVPEDLVIWLPLCEVERLIHYTRTPEDGLPIAYSLADGLPIGCYVEMTDLGRQVLIEHRAQVEAEGGAG